MIFDSSESSCSFCFCSSSKIFKAYGSFVFSLFLHLSIFKRCFFFFDNFFYSFSVHASVYLPSKVKPLIDHIVIARSFCNVVVELRSDSFHQSIHCKKNIISGFSFWICKGKTFICTSHLLKC